MDGSVESLSVHLDALKRNGANLLVVDPPALHPGCRDLMGVDDAPRRRLFVTTSRCSEALSAFDDDPDPDCLRHVSISPDMVRSSSNPCAESSAAEPWKSTVPSIGNPTEIAMAVDEHLAGLETDDPVSGEIRVCFDSLDPLIEEFDRMHVFRFLHAVTSRIRVANGLGHFHLTTGTDDRLRDTVEPLFEAVVEYRSDADGLAQRWRFRDVNLETDWLPLSP